MWERIFISIGGAGVLFAIVGFLTRSIILHFLNKDIEKHKYNLERIALEHSVRFTKLHEKRAEVIEKLYSKYIDFDLAIFKFIESDNNEWKKELEKEAKIAGDTYFDYSKDKNLFFPEETSELINKISNIQIDKLQSTGQKKNYQHLQAEGKKLKTNLENEFREILGVNAFDNKN